MEREKFGSRFAVIMAMAGSAIGLGNIWRFPYMVGENGGAAFIVVYLLCCLFLSLPVFFCESILGRSTRTDTAGALRKFLPGWRARLIGLVPVLTAFCLLSFYSVVGGWSADYFYRSCFTGFEGLSTEAATSLFEGMSSSVWEPVLGHTVFLLLTALIVLAGVEKGIGRFSKFTMPVLFITMALILWRSVTLPGASAGIEYLFRPDFSQLTGRSVASALGQSFFSMSLGVGVILTYSSYMKNDENILASGGWTALFDTLFALIAGLAIMPAVFSAGIRPEAGPSLVFETLPVIFSGIGPLVPILFFASILIAALSSSISVFEVCVAFLVEHKGLSRKAATWLVFAFAWILGVACAVGPAVFSFCDHLTSNYLMIFCALVFTMMVGWKMKKEEVRSVVTNGGRLRAGRILFPALWFLIRYVAPVAIAAIFLSNFLL
ncbi:MAG: sodium-dependent transporter [Bacteroidales bacterium]|nr:sodium-dependent transporter [Bacteroidales bacterium]